MAAPVCRLVPAWDSADAARLRCVADVAGLRSAEPALLATEGEVCLGPVPLRQPLHGLPPAWIACGEDDPLIADSVELAGGLAAAKVSFTLHGLPSLPHAFLMYSASLAPARHALQLAAQAVRGFFNLPSTREPK